MKKLFLSILCFSLGISLGIAQTKTVIKKKESAADYVSKNFKEKYVDDHFVDPYSYKPLKIWVSDSVTLNDSLKYYRKEIQSDSSFISYIKIKAEKAGILDIDYYGYPEKVKHNKSRINYLLSFTETERSVIILYKVKLDCYAKSRNGNESLMRLDITCNVLPDKTYYVRWWRGEDVYEYNK
jgi:hypothetical protein